MGKLEVPMTLWFWQMLGGLLIEESLALRRTANQGQRLINAVIVLGDKKRRLTRGAEFDLAGRDVIAVQSKHRRLGMTVAGQTLFSKELLKRFKPRSIRSVAVCTADDAVVRPLLERSKGCEVRVYPGRQRMVFRIRSVRSGSSSTSEA